MKNIFFTLTYKCNAFCEKCMTRKHIYRDNNIDDEVIEAFIRELTSINYKGIVSLGSGESLISPKLTNFVREILSINSEIRLRILTNGKLFCVDKMEPILKSNRIIWGVTFDGFKQNDLDNLQYGINIYDIRKNVEKWCLAGLREQLYINYTLNGQNIYNVESFINWASRLGVKEIYITELKIYKEFYDKLGKFSIDYTKKEHLNIIKRIMADERVKCSLKVNYNRKKACWESDKVMPIVDIDGSLSYCSGREDVTVCNIMENNAREKWKNFSLEICKHKGWCDNCHGHADENGLFCLPKNKYENN